MQENTPMEPRETTFMESKETSFLSSSRELLTALLSYVLGYLYIEYILKQGTAEIGKAMFCAAFTAVALFHFRDRLRKREHWIWLGCMWLCLLSELLGKNQVWESNYILFLHAFAVYWILSLSGKMMEGQSSAFLPLDALNGLIIIPFHRFFTFFRTQILIWGIRSLRSKQKVNLTAILYGAIAVLLSVCLLLGAGSLLTKADANFATFLNNILPKINPNHSEEILVTLLFSIPVGAYLCGLICGTDRVTGESLIGKKNAISSFLKQIRHVPNVVWTVLLCAFVILYLMFLGFQSSYFFGAFRRALPENFTVAEYARQGFFELCKILALNFGLFWLVCASSVSPIQKNHPAKIVSTILLTESMLFAVTALSKLILYIDCFGFTPLRLQSFWLVCVLLVGCILTLVSLWSRKKTMKLWIYITGISLALLHLY